MPKLHPIYCCQCKRTVAARLTTSAEVYSGRFGERSDRPFWVCDTCSSYVGCHYKSDTPFKPLGVIPTAAMRRKRQDIHAILDPLWRTKRVSRSQIYKHMARLLGLEEYHTAELDTLRAHNLALRAATSLRKELRPIEVADA